MSNPRALAQVTTAASALEGVGVTMDVSDASVLSVGLVCELYPAQMGDGAPLAKAGQTVRYEISAIAGFQLTGELNPDGYANPPQVERGWIIDGRYPLADVSLDALEIAQNAPFSALPQEPNFITLNSTPGTGSGLVRALELVLNVVPSSASAAEHSALMTFTNHNAGAFDLGIMRGVGATIVQNVAASVISEMRGLQALIAVSAGTATVAYGADVSWLMSGGAITTYVGYNTRQASSGGFAPTSEYGAILYGYNQMVKGLTIGSFTSPVNNALAVLMAITASGGGVGGINVAPSLTAAANNDLVYGINIALGLLAKGAFTGLLYYGMLLTAPASVTGAGTVLTAAQIYLELPAIATNNAYFRFGSALDGTALGAYAGRLPVITSAGLRYLGVYL